MIEPMISVSSHASELYLVYLKNYYRVDPTAFWVNGIVFGFYFSFGLFVCFFLLVCCLFLFSVVDASSVFLIGFRRGRGRGGWAGLVLGGAESRQTQLGAPERRAARAHHRRGHGEPRQSQTAARRRRDQETARARRKSPRPHLFFFWFGLLLSWFSKERKKFGHRWEWFWQIFFVVSFHSRMAPCFSRMDDIFGHFF